MSSSRRRGIAAAASALLAVALAVAIGGRGCEADDETPEGAVRAFIAAADAGDREALYQLLGPRTRAELDDRARRASEIAGGARRVEPLELVAVSLRGRRRTEPKRVEVVQQSGDSSTVRIVDHDGGRHELSLVRVGTSWRLELVD